MISDITTGEESPLLPHLIEYINRSEKIDFAIAFIKVSGLVEIEQALSEALNREFPIYLRILTGDYLNITDPEALNVLMRIKENNPERVELKVFETMNRTSFHPKVYIFKNEHIENHGKVIIGSSNISKSALTTGIEWNLIISKIENSSRFTHICNKYEELFNHPSSVELTNDWIEKYKSSFKKIVNTDEKDEVFVPEPHGVQADALEAIKKSIDEGLRRGLVVMATGLGKTWLAAFTASKFNFGKILFIAHREEILNQAMKTFGAILPRLTTGKFIAAEREVESDMIFASIQTLGKMKNLKNFKPNTFDLIVVDEFHHACARTYRNILNYFIPKFMLGLTATPDRTDGQSILELCDRNEIFRCTLIEGIEKALLCPFNYFGILDIHVDYESIPWRNSKFDETILVEHLATQKRAKHILTEWRGKSQDKTLAFCISQKHADFMADYFINEGVECVSVHSNSKIRRNEALDGLQNGKYQVVFSVDLFNEGVDVPEIDTVLMLRPTESKIIFLQQLGRGLRKKSNDKKLHILDFIGNHKSFLLKPVALFGIETNRSSLLAFFEAVRSNELISELPEGCHINYSLELIQLLEEMVKNQRDNVTDIYNFFKDQQGRRPRASELYHMGVSFTNIRKIYGSWFEMVYRMGDIEKEYQNIYSKHKGFLSLIERTSLNKCFKLITLEALIELNGFIKIPHINDLSDKALDIFERRPKFQREIEINDLDYSEIATSKTKWYSYWLNNPLKALAETGNTAEYFSIDNKMFSNHLSIEDENVESFNDMLQELIEFKFVQYSKGDDEDKKIVCKLWHSSSKAIIKLNEKFRSKLPKEETKVLINKKEYLVKFVKIAVNVIKDINGENQIDSILSEWFGPNPGRPGNNNNVIFEEVDGQWQLSPVIMDTSIVVPDSKNEEVNKTIIKLYPDLKIACGHFKEGFDSDVEDVEVLDPYKKINPENSFLAYASGNSMNGGKQPILDGELLLMERLSAINAGSLQNQVIATSIINDIGHQESVLREVKKTTSGEYELHAFNKEYEPFVANDSMYTFARFKRIVEPYELKIHQSMMRAEIAKLFHVEFNDSVWNQGHVRPRGINHQILLVNLNKSGFASMHRYIDMFENKDIFHWQSQNKVNQTNKIGREIIDHVKNKTKIHLFVRKTKLGPDKKAAPFFYCGEVELLDYQNNNPMNIKWRLKVPLSNELCTEFIQ